MDNEKIKKLSEMPEIEWAKIQSEFCKTNLTKKINKKEYTKDLLDVKKILDDEKITFWLIFGTLLGAVREKDFLDWDDNINIGTYKEELISKIDILKNKCISSGFIFRVIPKNRGTKVNLYRHNHKTSIQGLFLDPSYCNNKYRLSDKFRHPRKYFEKYGTIKFKGEEFRVPSPVKKYLKFLYKDWETPINLKDLPQDHKWRNKENRVK